MHSTTIPPTLRVQARLITPSVVSERLKVNGSVARQAIRHLEDPDQGLEWSMVWCGLV